MVLIPLNSGLVFTHTRRSDNLWHRLNPFEFRASIYYTIDALIAELKRLNPFEFRASIYYLDLCSANPGTVLIPLNSGLVFTQQYGLNPFTKEGLNPFEFRASIY